MAEEDKIKTVLVVDDDPVQVKLLEGVLTSNGFEVLTTTDASEGLQLAMDKQPDLILLDVMMPIINGFNFCKLLKSEEKQQHIPIILVTSRDQQEDIEIGLDMGAEAYITKPVKTEELMKTIQVVTTMGQKS